MNGVQASLYRLGCGFRRGPITGLLVLGMAILLIGGSCVLWGWLLTLVTPLPLGAAVAISTLVQLVVNLLRKTKVKLE